MQCCMPTYYFKYFMENSLLSTLNMNYEDIAAFKRVWTFSDIEEKNLLSLFALYHLFYCFKIFHHSNERDFSIEIEQLFSTITIFFLAKI